MSTPQLSGDHLLHAAPPRLVEHLVIRAEAEDVEAVGSPRRHGRRAGEDAAERFPVRRRRMPPRCRPRPCGTSGGRCRGRRCRDGPGPTTTTAGGLLNVPPSGSQPSRRRMPAASVPGLVVHLAVDAEAEDVEAVRAPRDDGRRAGERPPSGSHPVGDGCQPLLPRLVEHLAIGAEAEDVEAVRSPRRDRRRAGEDAAEGLPAGRRRVPAVASHALWNI